ncbi:ParA family protein [Pseudoflavonifractor sp. 524-17]|uniref:AAA family ATPase n=1 Tax=Pseudoflavonifractor sp. 524-17 TaxID=2304577 RepID=UPI00137A7FD0
MRTLAVVNLKGGVGKTVSAANIAHILAVYHHKKVLLVDGDKQGSASRYFGVYGEQDGTAALLLDDTLDAEGVERVIYRTGCKGLDIITSNMELYAADRALFDRDDMDTARVLFGALDLVRNDYDFCIIDNGPAADTVTLNVLTAADDVLIPIRPDEFSFSGLLDLVEQVDAVRESVNPGLTLRGAFFTHWQNREPFKQARQSLEDSGICPVFQTAISYNPKVPESTLEEMPLCAFAPRSWAAIQYKKLTAEYLALTDLSKGKEG